MTLLTLLRKSPFHRYGTETSFANTVANDTNITPSPRQKDVTGHLSAEGCAKGSRGVNGKQFEYDSSHMAHRQWHSCQNTTVNDTDLEDELCRLSECTAKLEGEVKERTELLRNLRERRARVIAEGEKLRRSGSSTPNLGSPRVSEARKACLEAYARMTPTQRYLMKEHQLRHNGFRRGDHEEEHLEWEFRSRQRMTSNMPQMDYYPHCPRLTENVRGGEEKMVNAMNKGTRMSLEECKESEKSRHLNSWELYETVWGEICSLHSDTSDDSLSFRHLPWPILDIFITIPAASAIVGDNVIDAALSTESISSFLFSSYHSNKKSRRRRLHEALLRYHPDRFEHRILHLVVEKERVAAGQAARRITDVLNSLLSNTC